jgi:hypothetical protein
LHGSYGIYRSGTGSSGGSLAAAGVAFFDGAGRMRTLLNISLEGEILLGQTFVGTYAIARDCTGKTFGSEGVVTDRFAVVDDGNGFYGVSVLEGNTILTVATRIQDIRD